MWRHGQDRWANGVRFSDRYLHDSCVLGGDAVSLGGVPDILKDCSPSSSGSSSYTEDEGIESIRPSSTTVRNLILDKYFLCGT
jgi:hypothetical protein